MQLWFDEFFIFKNLFDLFQDAMKNGRSSVQDEQPRNNQGLFKTHVFQVTKDISI